MFYFSLYTNFLPYLRFCLILIIYKIIIPFSLSLEASPFKTEQSYVTRIVHVGLHVLCHFCTEQCLSYSACYLSHNTEATCRKMHEQKSKPVAEELQHHQQITMKLLKQLAADSSQLSGDKSYFLGPPHLNPSLSGDISFFLGPPHLTSE